MPMREGAEDFPGFGRLVGIAAEPASNGFDQVRRQMGEVAEGLVFDLIAVATSAAQEMGFIDAALVCASGGGYVNGSGAAGHVGEDKGQMEKSQGGNPLFSGYDQQIKKRLNPEAIHDLWRKMARIWAKVGFSTLS